MAYNTHLAERIAQEFRDKSIPAEGRKFMGGYCFFLDDKMCIGLDIDKKTNRDRLMARIGVASMEKELLKGNCRPMDITGRPMKGFVFVDPEHFDMDEDLKHWIKLAVAFNPEAPKSKKK